MHSNFRMHTYINILYIRDLYKSDILLFYEKIIIVIPWTILSKSSADRIPTTLLACIQAVGNCFYRIHLGSWWLDLSDLRFWGVCKTWETHSEQEHSSRTLEIQAEQQRMLNFNSEFFEFEKRTNSAIFFYSL